MVFEIYRGKSRQLGQWKHTAIHCGQTLEKSLYDGKLMED